MPDWLQYLLIGLFGVVIGYCVYTLGVMHERMRHYQWMRDGWDLCVSHLDFLRLVQEPQEDALAKHLEYMIDVFGAGRTYPPEKREKVSKEK